MKYSVFEQKLIKKIEESMPGITPGLVVQVHLAGRKICDISVGDTYSYYDLASLTKIIFTTQAMINAFQQGQWDFKTKVKDLVGWFPHEHTYVFQLLNHSSGLPWHVPFFRDIPWDSSRDQKWESVARMIKGMNVTGPEESAYSDVGFLVLAFVLEQMYQKPLIEVWQDIKNQFYPDTTFEMHVDNKPIYDVRRYAPTERCQWRGRILQGEVHDENTWLLNGVTAHAGLFGSIDDVGWFGLMLRAQLMGLSRTQIKQKTAQMFATRSRPPEQEDWAMGYMMPTPGGSSAGEFFSSLSIGHTGFTGTSFWFDPQQDLTVSILSNRLFFSRESHDFKNWRPKIHNWIVEILRRN